MILGETDDRGPLHMALIFERVSLTFCLDLLDKAWSDGYLSN